MTVLFDPSLFVVWMVAGLAALSVIAVAICWWRQ